MLDGETIIVSQNDIRLPKDEPFDEIKDAVDITPVKQKSNLEIDAENMKKYKEADKEKEREYKKIDEDSQKRWDEIDADNKEKWDIADGKQDESSLRTDIGRIRLSSDEPFPDLKNATKIIPTKITSIPKLVTRNK